MRRIEVRLDLIGEQRVVGYLAEQNRGIYFEYAPEFLHAPLPISPFKLPTRAGVFEHRDREIGPVFGVFNDSLPDGWGMLLMDREFRKQGRDAVSVLDRLAYIGARGMGALTYHPAAPAPEIESSEVDLELLAGQAERILEGSSEEVLPALRLAGGSPGGARPKVLLGVRDDGRMISGADEIPEGYRHFLVKFSAGDDMRDIGAVELAYAEMARAAGVEVPPTRLFATAEGGRYFGVERFDRRGNERIHMHTLGGLVHADHRMPSLDYEGFLKATLILTRDHRQLEQAYRRMVFNVIAHNRDDHVKNFSYLMSRDGEWRLAPAYDLVYSPGPGGHHTTSVAGETARPTDRDMLRVADECDVEKHSARAIIDEVRTVVTRWPEFAASLGVFGESVERVEQALSKQRVHC